MFISFDLLSIKLLFVLLLLVFPSHILFQKKYLCTVSFILCVSSIIVSTAPFVAYPGRYRAYAIKLLCLGR